MATIDWTISQVRATALQMQADNVTLEAGQLGFESDTQKGKVGPGAYNSLEYKQDIDIAKANDAWETDQRDGGGDDGAGATEQYVDDAVAAEAADRAAADAALDADIALLGNKYIIDTGSTNTTTDPGQNTIRINNASLASATELSISDVDVDGIDQSTLNSLLGGVLVLTTVSSGATCAVSIVSSVHTSFTRFTVEYLKGSFPADGAVVYARFFPANMFDALAGKEDAGVAAALVATEVTDRNTAIAAALVGLWDDRGNYDASVNTFPASGGSGSAGAILKGDIWLVSVAGTLGGAAVVAGDTVRAKQDTPGQTAGNWAIAEGNVQFPIAQSKVTNLVSDLAAKAPLASPTFTGTPAAPTAAAATNTTPAVTGSPSFSVMIRSST